MKGWRGKNPSFKADENDSHQHIGDHRVSSGGWCRGLSHGDGGRVGEWGCGVAVINETAMNVIFAACFLVGMYGGFLLGFGLDEKSERNRAKAEREAQNGENFL